MAKNKRVFFDVSPNAMCRMKGEPISRTKTNLIRKSIGFSE